MLLSPSLRLELCACTRYTMVWLHNTHEDVANRFSVTLSVWNCAVDRWSIVERALMQHHICMWVHKCRKPQCTTCMCSLIDCWAVLRDETIHDCNELITASAHYLYVVDDRWPSDPCVHNHTWTQEISPSIKTLLVCCRWSWSSDPWRQPYTNTNDQS